MNSHCRKRRLVSYFINGTRTVQLCSSSFSLHLEPSTPSPIEGCSANWRGTLIMNSNLAYWIAFGPHGPRELPPPGEWWKLLGGTAIGVGVSFIIFLLIRTQARPPPGTMNQQYQEATNEYLKVRSQFLSTSGYASVYFLFYFS